MCEMFRLNELQKKKKIEKRETAIVMFLAHYWAT